MKEIRWRKVYYKKKNIRKAVLLRHPQEMNIYNEM